jgi:26S proteasome non-ATPase regulatory subunit 9
MATPLVDPQGFPRSDIDVAGIRTARHQINRLRNDLKACMNDMSLLLERGLPRVEGGQREEMEVEEEKVEMEGFARVDAVAPGSPADLAVSTREGKTSCRADEAMGTGTQEGG